jgi:hypothetical protein
MLTKVGFQKLFLTMAFLLSWTVEAVFVFCGPDDRHCEDPYEYDIDHGNMMNETQAPTEEPTYTEEPTQTEEPHDTMEPTQQQTFVPVTITSGGDGGFSAGGIAGVTVGGVAALLIMAALARKARKKPEEPVQEQPVTADDAV